MLDYGDTIYYDNCSLAGKQLLDMVHHRGARIVTGGHFSTNINTLLYEELGWETLQARRTLHKQVQFYKIANGHSPSYLSLHLAEKSKVYRL